ncbi:hypothetical protein DITRI_Ditri09bG0058400 [Diplodiscus trichospermus]
MILLWRAEGFLQEARDKHSIKDLGHEYFRELLSRFLLQRSNQDRSRFVMHDLINDLAQSVAGEICFRIEGDKKISKHTRHLSYIAGEYDGIKKFLGISEAQHLRTFLPLWLFDYGRCYVTNNVLTHLLPNLRCLRVLSLEGYEIFELPNFVKDLKRLRYLNFSRTRITCLPKSICDLYNLETLLLRKCTSLEKLPSKMENLVNLCYLDISGADRLEGVPSNFSTLRDLQTLSKFVLQEGKGCQIKELENLSNLKGRLCISGLKNVAETQDACKAKLHDKPGLDELELNWCKHFKNRKLEREKEVLDLLQPSKTLKELLISYYCGVSLVEWIGDSSFRRLQSLCLENCPNCTSLPSIGQLPSLKKVDISELHSVTSVGVEFFGKNVSNAFTSLESLTFAYMSKWETWSFIGVDEEARKFPRLRELVIRDCPKLLGSIPEYISSLEKLEIDGCQKLVMSIQMFSKLSKLNIRGCHKVVYKGFADGSSLKSVSFANISQFTCAAEQLTMLGSIKVESLVIGDCKELCSPQENNWGLLTHSMTLDQLKFQNCPQIVSIGAGEEREGSTALKIPSTIQQLGIYNCESLEKLSTTLHYVTLLSVLRLFHCPKLIYLSMNNLPLNLKILAIASCENLKWSSKEEGNGNVSNTRLLEKLEIQCCGKLISLLSNNLPLNLKRLVINNCLDLRCLLEERENVNSSNACLLEQLQIYDCEKVIFLSNNNLPNLKSLNVWSCVGLRCLLEGRENVDISNSCLLEQLEIDNCPSLIKNCGGINTLPQGLNKLSHLQKIIIRSCSNLISFPENGLPISNLKVLALDSCEKLEAVPNLPNCLENLELANCSSVRSLPEEGIPTNLKTLKIAGTNICKLLIEWGLHRLTSLQHLSISNGYPDAVSFPQEEIGLTLPCSLTFLSINSFPKLEILSSKGFQDLTSLEYLYISDCPNLKSLPEKDMLSSLLVLSSDGHDCPMLVERCKKDKGPEWPKIAHIPCVQFIEWI